MLALFEFLFENVESEDGLAKSILCELLDSQ